MTYTIKSTERTRKSGSDMETKALLYLMNFREDSDDIHYFIVDFFNDLTGMNRTSSKVWDVQSKATANSSPKAIGRELVTLYKNYLSEFTFDFLILFLGGVSNTVRIDKSINIFGIQNVRVDAISKIKEGLKEECDVKTYIDSKKATDLSIDEFIQKVTFVVDDKEPSDYVKAIIKEHPHIIPDEKRLIAIFNEIRNEQSGKKNGNMLEGVTISTRDESLSYYRHLTNNEIRLMTLHRIINRDPIEQGIPMSFLPILNKCAPEKQKDMIDECQSSLCRALFNKNMAQSFWNLFEQIYSLIINNPTNNTQLIYTKVNPELIENCPDFDILSVKYFISVVKDGIQG